MDIKRKIKDCGFTISEVASKMPNGSGGLGISQPALSAIINGNPTINKLKDIADIIGLTLSELVADETAPIKAEQVSSPDIASLKHRLDRLEESVGEILKEMKQRLEPSGTPVDALIPILDEIKLKIDGLHQDLRYRTSDIKSECEGLTQDFRQLFSLLEDRF